MMKLTKLFHNFNPRHWLPAKAPADFTALEAILPVTFPDELTTYRWIEQVKAPRDSTYNVYTAQHLPYHTHDNGWLCHYLAQLLKAHGTEQTVPLTTINSFVGQSAAFSQARDAYELRLAKAQIKYMTRHIKSNGLMSARLDEILTDPDYDIKFHGAVLSAMANLGVDSKIANDALEIYADMWRQTAMTQAFHNGHSYKTTNGYAKDEHFRTWLPLRENYYYSLFYHAVDRVGSATDGMKISHEQKKALTKINQEHEARYQNGWRACHRDELKAMLGKYGFGRSL